MPFVHENVKVELFPGTPSPIVYLSENDVGDTLAFELVYKGQPVNVPSGSAVKFKGTKKDGLGFTVNSSNVSGNVVSFVVSQDMTSCSGIVESEISITLSNNKHGTCNVVLIVEKNPHSDGTQDGSYPQIVSEMMALVNQIEGDAETASNAANTAVAAKNSALEIQQDVHQYTASVIDDWLDNHPEATTTVQDGAITYNKLNAEIKVFVTPEMFGAKGDGVTDDSIAIQNALNSGNPVIFSEKTYHIESTIEISNHGSSSAVWVMDARNAKFHYTGNDYAFFIHSLINSRLYFGSIISTNGGNIKFISGDTSAHKRSQYVTIEFGIMQAASGFSNVYAENSGTEWINEIKWIGGRFVGESDCNFNIVRNAPNNEINGWGFYRIGFEGSTTCIQLGGNYAINNFGIYDCRYTESYTNFIVANGSVLNLVVYSPRPVPMEKVHWNNNCDRWRFYTGNYESLSIKKGVVHYINTSRSISGGIEIEANTDIDDVTLVGNYVIGTTAIANTLINLPLASAGKLIVESLTSNGILNPDDATSRYLLQTFIPLQAGVKFTRRINITNSGASKEVFEWIPSYQYYPNLSFSSGDDLDNYLSVGTWYSSNSALTQSLSNTPSGISNTFRLDVIAINSTKGTGFVSGMVRQQKIQDGKGHIFIRMLSTANNVLSIGNWLQVTTSTV